MPIINDTGGQFVQNANGRTDAGWHNREQPQASGSLELGKYNKVHSVTAGQTFDATGSNAGAAAFVVENVMDAVIETAGGGQITASGSLDQGTLYELGVIRVVAGTAGIVHVLYK